MAPPETARAAPRFTELDSLRGLAALGVVLWHYSGMFGSQPLAEPLKPFYASGGLLVDFFFVLSGFVLSLSFDREPRRTQFARNVWARVARMYPLHAVTLLVIVACDLTHFALGQTVWRYDNGYHFALNLLLLQSSGLQQNYSFNGPSWSISAEFLVNLLFLALIARGGRLGRWLMAALAVICGALLLRQGILNDGVPVSGRLGGWLDLSLVRCWFGFYIGTRCFAWYRAHPRGEGPGRWQGDLLGGAALLLVVAYMAKLLPQSHGGDVLLALLGFPALILGAVHSRHLRTLLLRRPLTWLGQVSYSIYLVHFPLIVLLLLLAGFTGPLPMASPWMLVVFYALVLATAALSYRYVEMPGKRWLAAAWPSPRQQVAGQAAAAGTGRRAPSRQLAYRRLAR